MKQFQLIALSVAKTTMKYATDCLAERTTSPDAFYNTAPSLSLRQSATGLKYWLVVPPQADITLPPIVAIHGILRGAKSMAKRFTTIATQNKRVLIAPLFDELHWKGYQRPGNRFPSDVALIQLMKELGANFNTRFDQYELFGYSAGAQFVHRFALRFPRRVSSLGVCSSGWFTSLDSQDYPYGLGHKDDNSNLQKNLPKFLAIPCTVWVGEQDITQDDNLRNVNGISALQGDNRVKRASWWVGLFNSQAKAAGQLNRARLSVLKQAGHDFKECMSAGIQTEYTELLRRAYNG